MSELTGITVSRKMSTFFRRSFDHHARNLVVWRRSLRFTRLDQQSDDSGHHKYENIAKDETGRERNKIENFPFPWLKHVNSS